MKYKRYIRKLYSLTHKMNNLIQKMEEEGLIDKSDKFVTINDLGISIHEVEKAFEQDISH